MSFDTLEQYEEEAKVRRGGLRGVIGRVMTFAGFIVLANAFFVALLFRHILSFRNQLILGLAGGVVGVAGMLLAGNTRKQVTLGVEGAASAILGLVLMELLMDRFGFWGGLAVAGAFAFLVIKLEERSWRKL